VPRAAKRSAQQVFDNMPNDFQAAKSKGVRLTVRFKLSGSGGGDWYVRVDDGKLSITKGSGPKPDVTLIADADDYVKIAAGDMNGPIAFLRGKLRVDGDTALMRKFESMFEYDEG
jgi:putative sterol carrier protein